MNKEIQKVKIKAENDKVFIEFLKQYPGLDMAAERRQKNGKIHAEAYVEREVANNLSKPGIDIEIIENASETGKQRQQEISKTNRFELAGEIGPPHGFAKKE